MQAYNYYVQHKHSLLVEHNSGTRRVDASRAPDGLKYDHGMSNERQSRVAAYQAQMWRHATCIQDGGGITDVHDLVQLPSNTTYPDVADHCILRAYVYDRGDTGKARSTTPEYLDRAQTVWLVLPS